VLKQQNGIYCIDSDGIEEPEKHLLLNMVRCCQESQSSGSFRFLKGTMLEKFITHTPSQFDNLLRNSPITDDFGTLNRPESYRYSKVRFYVCR
jgi:hypothetical protein